METFYDPRGRVSSVAQGSGPARRQVAYTYGANGRVEVVTDTLNREKRFAYDGHGRVSTITLPDGKQIGFAYDLNGNLTQIVPPERPPHVFGLDEANRTSSYEPPTLGAGTWGTSLSYNQDRQLTSLTRPDGLGITLSYESSSGRLQALSHPTGSTTYAFEPSTGNLQSVTTSTGVGLSYSFDGSVLTGLSQSGPIAGSVSWSFDDAGGGRTNFWVVEERLNASEEGKITIDYDVDGAPTRVGELNIYREAQNGLLIGSQIGEAADRFEHDSFGAVTKYEAGAQRLGQSCAPAPAPNVCQKALSLTYTRDGIGRIEQRIEQIRNPIDGPITQVTLDYEYDTLGRLVEVRRGTTVVESYTFDANGNRTAWTNGYGTFAASYDAQDRLTSVTPSAGSPIDYTYTAAGELLTKTRNGQTVSTTYDVLGNLNQVVLADGIEIEYLHDGRNRRVAKKVNGAIVKGWLYSTGSLPIAETNASGAITTRFVYGTRRLPEYFERDGSKFRLYTEPNGSVRFVIQIATGAVVQQINYDSFGNVTFDSNPGFQPFGYGGGLYEPQTGLTRFGARDYDPYVGRWTAKDPIGFAGGDTNLYGYVVQDPVNRVDPSGLASDCAEHYSADGVPLGYNLGASSGSAGPTIGACTPTLYARVDRFLERISGNSSSAKLGPGSSFTTGDFRDLMALNVVAEGFAAFLSSARTNSWREHDGESNSVR